MIIKIFGAALSIAVLITTIAMIVLGAKWQKVERSAYASEKRPGWFIALCIFLIIFYIIALIEFILGQKTIAAWILIVVLPIGWALKAAIVIFNSKGREIVSEISGDEAWVKIGLARLPIAILLGLVAWFA